jgi:hypothetical protein
MTCGEFEILTTGVEGTAPVLSRPEDPNSWYWVEPVPMSPRQEAAEDRTVATQHFPGVVRNNVCDAMDLRAFIAGDDAIS